MRLEHHGVADDKADVFAERLLQIIDEGRRTATYKLALLTALIDVCASEGDQHGRPPATLHTRSIARHVLRLYLPQVRLYAGGNGERSPGTLRQITNKQSTALNAVLRLHLLANNAGLRGLDNIARGLPDEFERCLDTIELTFARYPLVLLQNVGRQQRPFIYDIAWSHSITLAALHAPDGGLVHLRPGAGDHLLRLAPLLRPLIELHWTRMVARLNQLDIEGERLRSHLFGTARATFPTTLRAGLSDLQTGRCFYCDDLLPASAQVDHVIPWTRWPNDAIENLVLADRCNSYKRDYLPALVHVDRWARRLDINRAALADIASLASWETDRPRTIALARSAYAHLPPGTPLWLAPDDFTDDDPALITHRLTDTT